ncbi:MAG TPA: hypothetical protein DEP66_00340 [Acidimicrobiaceae bacterium]|nr:hypothetical protein [Acidimicrobiaceae bacterium]HCB36694.1 hypothetical protein [Acidimicrobiaceae bacterium]
MQDDDGPALFHLIASELLSSNWPESLHDEICESVNLRLDSVEIDMARARARAADETDTEGQRRRDPKFRELVLRAYERQCAMCGWDGQLDASTVGLEAAHVKWWAFDGPDEIQNGLCLCSMHHRLFDKGAIGVSKDHRVAVSERFVGRGPTAEAFVLSRNGTKLLRPQRSEYEPLPEYLAWHHDEVFREPERQQRGDSGA